MSTFGQRIKYEREKRGWTLALTAKKLGISRGSTYSNWEYDISEPDIEMIVKISNLFEKSTDYLLGNDESSNISESTPILSKEDIEIATSICKLTKEQKNIVKQIINSYQPPNSQVKTSSTLTNGEEATTIETA